MSLIEKLHSVLILAAVGVGLALGQLSAVSLYSDKLIVPALFFMLYGLFLSIPLSDLKKGFLHYKFAAASISINFIWTPVFAWFLGAVFLSQSPALWIGFVMLMVTPCTDWYLVFTGIAKGDLPLSASILPVNLFLQVILLPVYLLLFTGVMETISPEEILKSILLVVVLPFALALLTRSVAKRGGTSLKNFIENKMTPFFGAGQIYFLLLAIAAMFASQGNYLVDNIHVVLILLVPVLLFFLVNFILAQIAGRLLKFTFPETVSLNLTTLARNSPLALAIAVSAFPDEPLIPLALVIGPLIELPVLALVSQVLLHLGKRPGRN